MSKKTLFVGAIASIIAINSVIADTTVTSRQYVDTEVAKKQDIIESAMIPQTTSNLLQDQLPSIASYDEDDDDGLVANKYGILTYPVVAYAETYLTNAFDLENPQDLAVADKVVPTAATVQDALQHLAEGKANKMTCAGWPDGVSHTVENCWLWQEGVLQ